MRVEKGVIVGSNGKYNTRNPIGKRLLAGFDRAILACLKDASPQSVLEIGCGEGHVTELILETSATSVLATDISPTLLRENRERFTDPRVSFEAADLMTLQPDRNFDTVVCCEVLEHLDDPRTALENLRRLNARQYVLSVPREPLFRSLNVCRGAYLTRLGSSPGHLNHWSQSAFLKFIGEAFVVQSLLTPIPWTVVRCRLGP